MYFIIALFLLLLDQGTKWWSSTTFPLNAEGRYVFLGFYFTYVQNTGAAFGMFQNGTLALGILSAVVSFAILIYLIMQGSTMPVLQRYALASILAGAVGNMIDRFRLGYVIDFIHFNVPGFSFPVFNVADSCVVIGAILLVGSSLFSPSKPKVSYIELTPERQD
ncbi:MAG: signal peptidase II [Trueperaceae bacterium]